MRRVRYSELRAFMWCRRNWLNAYYLGLVPKGGEDSGDRPPGTRHIGTLVHKDLEAYYRGLTTAPGEFARAEKPPVSAQFQKEWDNAYEMARIMATGYGKWLADEGHDQGETTLEVEYEMTLPFPDLGITLVMHTDRIFKDAWGEVGIEDTKSVDNLLKDDTFAVDWQLLTYIVGAQANGIPASYARHNMLKRNKQTARANPPFYGRVEMRPNAEQLTAHRSHLHAALSDMRNVMLDLERDGVYSPVCYPSPGKDCSWRCDFKAICAMHDDGSDLAGVRETIYQLKETTNV